MRFARFNEAITNDYRVFGAGHEISEA